MNSDDFLLPGAVYNFVKTFREKDTDVISGHGYKVNESGGILGRIFSHKFDPIAYVFGACVLVQQSTFFRADCFRRVGGFNIDNRVSWDGELWFDMARAGVKFGRIHAFPACFRMHAGSITVSGRVAHLEMEVKRRLALKLGIPEMDIERKWEKLFYRICNRLADPVGTALRAFEAVR